MPMAATPAAVSGSDLLVAYQPVSSRIKPTSSWTPFLILAKYGHSPSDPDTLLSL